MTKDKTAKIIKVKEDDDNNCSVLAMVNLLGIEYIEAYKHFKEAGRHDSKGARVSITIEAFKLAGYNLVKFDSQKIISKYPGNHKTLKHVTSKHPIRFKACFSEEDNYYCSASNHGFSIVKGVTEDWSSNHQLQIKQLYTVEAI